MNLKTLKNINIKGKTILYRSPYDVGVSKTETGEYVIKDDSRLKATIPTLTYLIENDCKIVILTWVGRPDGKIVEELRTTPHAKMLSTLLGKEVKKVDDCIGITVEKAVSELRPGELLMLENTRFYKEEDGNDENFARELTKYEDLIVFDGFPQAHRIHSSTTGILKFLPAVAGFYFEKEVSTLSNLLENPAKPFTVIIGGAKVSDKIDAINNLFGKADMFLLGGGPANVFLKAEGKEIANSYIEDVFVDSAKKEKKDWVEYATEIKAKDPRKIILPLDLVITNNKDTPTEIKEVTVTQESALVPQGWMALDAGTKTQKLFADLISNSKTVFWNGPMGMFENEKFSQGTAVVAKAMETSGAMTVIAGGDTIEAAKKYCNVDKITNLSLAGGASLEFLAGKELPVVKLLQE